MDLMGSLHDLEKVVKERLRLKSSEFSLSYRTDGKKSSDQLRKCAATTTPLRPDDDDDWRAFVRDAADKKEVLVLATLSTFQRGKRRPYGHYLGRLEPDARPFS